MDARDRLGELDPEMDHRRSGKRALASHRSQRAALDFLQRDVARTFDRTRVDEPNDAGMMDAPEQLRFAEEASTEGRFRRRRFTRVNHFEEDRSAAKTSIEDDISSSGS